ncbi:cupin domain-containing protein [Ensifer aridi]|uniref:cupin domain-containing protein n=1 Tax=Ensifer aridi TaxID=1708715 RepID=UPI000A12173C|nr:cupin domain-containing protein [Ensifer aridi]
MTTLPNITRIITGHALDGRSIVVGTGNLPTVVEIAAIPGTVFHEVWSTGESPAAVGNGVDPTLDGLILSPPAGGTRFRFVDIPPDTEEFLSTGADRMEEAFAEIGERHATTVREDSPHPLMHRTESLDYGVVIEGEVILILDEGEVLLKPGSVVIQRGTNHAWANRSGKPCRMLFVLISGRYEPSIAASLAGR